MSTRERPSKEKENAQQSDKTDSREQSSTSSKSKSASPTIDDWLDSFNPEQVKSDKENTSQEADVDEGKTGALNQETSKSIDHLLEEFTQNLPNWIDKPWMYAKPNHDGHLQSWYQSWKDLILSYTSILTRHIINIYDLQEVHPFTHDTSRKQLTINQIQHIVDHMVEENMAKWLDNETIRARIYYKTDKEWAEELYQFTLEHGYALDVMTLYDLHQLDEDWSHLPDNELRIVLDILVDENKAEWVGSDKDTIQFKL